MPTRLRHSTPVADGRRDPVDRLLERDPAAPPEFADHWLGRLGPQAVARADRIIEGGWVWNGLPAVTLAPPIAWDAVCALYRTWAFALHSWDPLVPVLEAFDTTRDTRYLDFALGVALDWAESYPARATESTFAWYDMAVGLRAQRLAYLLEAALWARRLGRAELEALVTSVRLHAHVLHDEPLAERSNHGLYVAAGQLALAMQLPELPEAQEGAREARQRLERMLLAHFTTEGVHREHSPAYHRAVLGLVDRLLDAGLIGTSALPWKGEAAWAALGWLTTPDGGLAGFGDTDTRPLDADDLAKRSERMHGANAQADGIAARGLRVFPEGGYAVVRHDVAGGTSYLAQTCAFHSRIHKHADDLSLVWHDRGAELLVDAGRYGYEGRTPRGSDLRKAGFRYADPGRVYVESTRAHNTVEIDGRSFNRRKELPYGSALRRWAEIDGLYLTEARVRHRRVRHTRVLAFKPGDWLVVIDRLADRGERPHGFVQRFHFAPELELADRAGIGFAVPGADEDLFMAPLLRCRAVEPVRGSEPELLGWTSRAWRELTPCWTAAYAADDVLAWTFAALLSFGTEAPEPLPDESGDREDGMDLRWKSGTATHALDLGWPAEGGLGASYTAADRPRR